MKKLLLSFIAIVTFFSVSQTAQAQYEKGDLLINPGISLLGYGRGFAGTYTGLPALTASVEYNVTDNIAVGGYAGYQSRSYRYDLGATRYTNRWTNLGFGVRGIFHASEVLSDALSANIDSEKWDIYGGLLLGYEIWTWNYDSSLGSAFQPDYDSGRVVFGGVLGTRYMFKERLGVYGELGAGGFGALTLGVTLKL